METPNGITKEEHFAYLISQGESKTAAYRAVFPLNEYTEGSLRVIAWRYANSPAVLSLLANEADNLYVKYNKARTLAFDTLLDLTLNSTSEKVQSDSAIGLLNQTAKLAKKIEVELVNNEFTDALTELRETLLTPHSIPSEGNNSINNSNLISQKFDPENNMDSNSQKFLEAEIVKDYSSIVDDNFSKLDAFKACGVRYIIGNKPLTLQVLNDQQFESINPLSSRDGDLNARITDTHTGRFVSYNIAREYLEKN